MSYPGRFRYRCSAPYCENVFLTDISDKNYINRHFFKFPKNIKRRQRWYNAFSEYGFKTNFSDFKTYYLCDVHFSNNCFTNTLKKGLHKVAVPSIFTKTNEVVNENIQEGTVSQIVKSNSFKTQNIPDFKAVMESSINSVIESNVDSVAKSNTISGTPLRDKTNDFCNVTPSQGIKRKLVFDESNLQPCKQRRVLEYINAKTINELTPRKRKLYLLNRRNSEKICKLKKKLFNCRQKCKVAPPLAAEQLFEQIQGKLDPATVSILKSQIRNVSRKRNVWDKWTKLFALSLYKRAPKAYRFLSKFFILPSKNTVLKSLRSLPFAPGINERLFARLKTIFQKLPLKDRFVSVMFDEIHLSKDLQYCGVEDEIVGFVDFGDKNRSKQVAKHALVFMIQGLRKKFKQPIAFYFTENSIPSNQLKTIIIDIIKELQNINLMPVVIVCDQGPTNRRAVNELCGSVTLDQDQGYFFHVNRQKIFAMFDPPHLLKNTRNALFNYDIQYEQGKIAKFGYIKQCFDIDHKKRFQTLRKLRPMYFKLKGFNPYKMKVSIAAKMLSHTVAAAIESMCSTTKLLPTEAIFTAEFVAEIDSLFDSFNGSGNLKHCKPLLKPLAPKSRHIVFWKNMIEKIKAWIFIDGFTQKDKMPFKSGWLQSLYAIQGLWGVLQQAGFKFLRTRALNQDAVENLFACIRQYGAANTSPNCYQFISALKTSVLTNLINRHSEESNCEEDNNSLLDNLNSLLIQNCNNFSAHLHKHNELLQINIPNTEINLDDSNFDSQAITYVCGYLVKKFPNLSCEICLQSLTSDLMLPQHTFVMFKEYDNKKRLIYASQELVNFVAKIHNLTNVLLKDFGHVRNIKNKLIEVVMQHVDLSWFSCGIHQQNVIQEITSACVLLLIRKYCDDFNRSSQEENRTTKTSEKLKKMQHCR